MEASQAIPLVSLAMQQTRRNGQDMKKPANHWAGFLFACFLSCFSCFSGASTAACGTAKSVRAMRSRVWNDPICLEFRCPQVVRYEINLSYTE